MNVYHAHLHAPACRDIVGSVNPQSFPKEGIPVPDSRPDAT